MLEKISILNKFLLIIFILCFICSGSAIGSDKKTTPPMTLHEVLLDVIATHPEIKEAKERYKSVVEERSIATSGYRPRIGTEASAGYELTEGYDTGYHDKGHFAERVSVYLRQNLYSGGATKAFVEETDARILAAAYEVITVANRVFLDTTEAYINVLKSRELLKLAELNVLTQEKILNQVKEKTSAGFTRLSDLSNSKARLALAKSNYISNQQDLKQAVAKFHRQLGRFLQPEQFVAPEPAYQFPATLEDTVNIGLKNHPALEVAKYNIHARKYAYERAKGADWPTIDFEVKASHTNDVNADDGYTHQLAALLKLSYEFYDGGVRKGEKGQKYRFLLKEYQRAYTERRNVNQAIRLAWNIWEAEKIKRSFLTETLDLSAETLEAFVDEYHVGRRTLLDLLNMENEYNDARIANAESEFSNLIAYYRISQATGVLIHEYDTGLLEEMGLPPKTPYDLAKYEKKDLNPNRDFDTVVDVADQCDNSEDDSIVLPSGCADREQVRIGYQQPSEITPYITPKEIAPLKLIDPKKDVQTISLNNIHFLFDSSELTDDAKEIIKGIADELNANPGFAVEIVGHTDSIASEAYNQKLSEARASSVLKELKKIGIDESRLSASGRGELEPVAPNDTAEGRQLNRRTEFKLSR